MSKWSSCLYTACQRLGPIGLAVCLLLPARAQADEVTGTWTGRLRGNLHYFWENSTRVVMPAGGLDLVAPNGIRVSADYLVDAITSASIGFGVDSDDLFTEQRHQPQLTLGKEFRLSQAKLDLSAVGRYSRETDYESLSAGLTTRLAINEDNTIFQTSVVGLHDGIENNSDPNFSATLNGWTASLQVEQVMTPTTVLLLGYQLGHLEGFIANPYRSVGLGRAPEPENPPDRRTRHTMYGRLAQYVPAMGGAVHLLLRGYTDTWDMWALNPELRVYKEFGDLLMVRVRYRYYRQHRAWFYRDAYPAGWDEPFTADPKLAGFDAHMVGLRFDLDTPFLTDSFLDFAKNSSIFLSLNYNFTGIRYGNAVNGTAGGILRF